VRGRPSSVTTPSPAVRRKATADDVRFAQWCRLLCAAERSATNHQLTFL